VLLATIASSMALHRWFSAQRLLLAALQNDHRTHPALAKPTVGGQRLSNAETL
jgi:hypothetical protein